MSKPLTIQDLARLGGSTKSDAKTAAARENGKRGGRPRKVKECSQTVTVTKPKPKPEQE